MWNWVLDLIGSTDDALLWVVSRYGTLAYLIIFLIVYTETGLLVFPFLPGDGLLFSIGVLTGLGYFNLFPVLLILILAAILGNITSYLFGYYGRRFIYQHSFAKIKGYIAEAEIFYRGHGHVAIVLARFLPIFRTYVPVIAGLTSMPWKKFLRFTILGAIMWVLIFVILGLLLGEIDWVKNNYGFIFFGLIVLTILPLPLKFLIGFIRRNLKKSEQDK